MPDFKFEALASTGLKETGVLTASTEREAASILDARGLFPIRVSLSKGSVVSNKSTVRVGKRYVAAFYSQLADLIHSGVPLLKSLDVLTRQSTKQQLSFAIREVRAAVADGTTLADAMNGFPGVFDDLAVSMIRAGQEGGFLEDVLRRISQFYENQEDLRSKVAGSLAYPIILAVIGSIILVVLIVFFVPRFEEVFEKLRQKGGLPTITTFVLGVSRFMVSYWYIVLGMGLATVFGFYRWKTSPTGSMMWDRIKLSLPLAGPLVRSLALGRFTRILGTLLANGIPIVRSLQISKDSSGNKVLAAAIEEAAENVTAGEKLAGPFRKSKYIPRDIVEMIAVAEESNNLEKVLVDIANNLDKRTQRNLELFVRLLEPAMLLVMAMIVGVVVAGLLLPVFRMGSTV
ncbi:MAG: type II secretion system F family protein [Zavarzinella sp.]